MTVAILPDLSESDPALAVAILRRSEARCEIGARGCDATRQRMAFLHVDATMPVDADTVLHVCRPCAARAFDDPALALRLSGVPA